MPLIRSLNIVAIRNLRHRLPGHGIQCFHSPASLLHNLAEFHKLTRNTEVIQQVYGILPSILLALYKCFY